MDEQELKAMGLHGFLASVWYIGACFPRTGTQTGRSNSDDMPYICHVIVSIDMTIMYNVPMICIFEKQSSNPSIAVERGKYRGDLRD